MKYILVTGGTLNVGIGRNVVASSVGALLKACDLNVTAIKIDPYINIDAGNFAPSEHGEVFVSNDGSEVALDLGSYERFMDINLGDSNYITTGKIYQQVIERERKGDYLGKTVQIIPHVTDAIQEWIENVAKTQLDGQETDICIIELGGTVGDTESMPYIEALRQLQRRVKRENFCCVHVTPVPRIGKELKSELAQASIANNSSLGIHPDMIVCLTQIDMPMDQTAKDKISLYCGVKPNNIFNLFNKGNIYRVPIDLHNQRFIKSISSCLEIHACTCDRLEKWKQLGDIAVNAQAEIVIALVGDRADLNDSYESVIRAIEHACLDIETKPNIRFIDASLLEDNDSPAWDKVRTSHCMIVPGGFEFRGCQGKMKAIKWARENKLPFLGIGLGFQLAVIEYARNVLSWVPPISEEFTKEFTKELKGLDVHPVVIEMLEYEDPENKVGGTMRLGLRKTFFTADSEDSIVRKKYGNMVTIEERHRHRYEVDPKCVDEFDADVYKLKFVGKSGDGTRADIFEMNQEKHPYFVGVQFHPEYLSRPFKPAPLYQGLIEAGKIRKKERDEEAGDE